MRFVPFVLLAVLSLPALSQSDRDDMPQSIPEVATEEGLKFGYDIGLTTNWDYNQYLSGIEDGHYFKIGARAKLALTLLKGAHEWRHKIIWAESFAKTPVLDSFIKSDDYLVFESLWMWMFGGWWGTYGQFNFDTSVFPGVHVAGRPTDYIIAEFDGSTTNVTGTDTLTLTRAFQPIFLKEQMGLYFRFMTYRYLTWEAKAGVYALQTFAHGARRIDGRNGAGAVLVSTLGNFYQVGPTIGTHIFGEIAPKVIFYQFEAEAGYAAYDNAEITIADTFLNRMIMTSAFSLTLKPTEWIAFTYSLRAAYFPHIRTGLQLQSMMMLSFQFAS